MHDTLYYSKPFRTLNVIDESNREILAIEIDTSLPAGRVIRILEQLGEIYGLPQAIRLDNGPELRSEPPRESRRLVGFNHATAEHSC